MGNHKSTRWRGHARKVCIEDCRRLAPLEAGHVGIATTSTAMPRGGLRLWVLCPLCGGRRGVLFQAPGSSSWGCRDCLRLSYRARQTRRVRVPSFEAFAARHPLWRALLLWIGSGRLDVSASQVAAVSEAIENAICSEHWAGLSDAQRRRMAGCDPPAKASAGATKRAN